MRRMSYPRKLIGFYRERPPDCRCCEHCSLNGECSFDTEHAAEIIQVGTGAGDMARISVSGRIIDVPLTEIHFKEET